MRLIGHGYRRNMCEDERCHNAQEMSEQPVVIINVENGRLVTHRAAVYVLRNQVYTLQIPPSTTYSGISFFLFDLNCSFSQGMEFITKLPPRESGHLYMIRSSYSKFPLFDGFLVALLPHNVREVTGYQVKLGRHTPQKAVPKCVNGGGVLIRGIARASPRAVIPNGWRYMEQNQIEEFLGYSLKPLSLREYPRNSSI
eukprot:gene8220-9067_t